MVVSRDIDWNESTNEMRLRLRIEPDRFTAPGSYDLVFRRASGAETTRIVCGAFRENSGLTDATVAERQQIWQELNRRDKRDWLRQEVYVIHAAARS